MKVWLKQGLKHPFVYIDATMHNTYGYFYPYAFSPYVYYVEYPTSVFIAYDWDFHFTSSLLSRKILARYASFFALLPVARLVSSIGFGNLLIIIMGYIFFKNKEKRKYILGLIPFYITYLVCFASPVNNYFRYAMPVVFQIPFLIVYFIYVLKKRIK